MAETSDEQRLTKTRDVSGYQINQYEQPSVTVDMLIFTVTNEGKTNYRKLPDKVLRLLLVKRKDPPFIGQWALPGGFVKMNEGLEEAAIRELKEKTNIENIYMEQLYTWGEVGRDPRTRVISCSYMSLVDSATLTVKASKHADDAKWFTVSSNLYQEQKTVTDRGMILRQLYNLTLFNDEEKLSAVIKIVKTIENKVAKVERSIIKTEGIAFDHAKVIDYGITRLRRKIEYTDIAFNLMPELFTLTELQQVYEVILDRELLKANFRRKIADMVVETNEYRKDAGHRPSKLFRFRPEWGVARD
ncbi:hypothetical protein P22_1212 [Propionispora sp. 2/2-37]|uniref:NUDIX hydrolase n=1 Tax=Propionispora sp. 2/2-37 TaxID=1677858 RepID=UPI0006BB5E95|nr:NUDIX domain-containing protein [Propionispora sp. 2/2-37]CUH95143.1 hypothetical protein P22_1212 [Propionispora sp. 2/2-37]